MWAVIIDPVSGLPASVTNPLPVTTTPSARAVSAAAASVAPGGAGAFTVFTAGSIANGFTIMNRAVGDQGLGTGVGEDILVDLAGASPPSLTLSTTIRLRPEMSIQVNGHITNAITAIAATAGHLIAAWRF